MNMDYNNVDNYDKLLFEEGIYYPMIFNKAPNMPYYVFMPIKDMNDDISVGHADTFEEAYELARKYLLQYYMQYGKYPRYINPYRVELEDEEFLVMVKIYY